MVPLIPLAYGPDHEELLNDHNFSNKCSVTKINNIHTTKNNSMKNIIRLLVWDEARTKNNINFHKINLNLFINTIFQLSLKIKTIKFLFVFYSINLINLKCPFALNFKNLNIFM